MNYKVFGIEFNLLNVVVCITLGFLICFMIGCDCVDIKKAKEAFQNMKICKCGNVPCNCHDKTDIHSMLKPLHTISGSKQFAHSKQEHKMMPASVESEKLFYLRDDTFKPECCPSTYSNSLGCACLSEKQYNFLNSRGGNRTHATEF